MIKTSIDVQQSVVSTVTEIDWRTQTGFLVPRTCFLLLLCWVTKNRSNVKEAFIKFNFMLTVLLCEKKERGASWGGGGGEKED